MAFKLMLICALLAGAKANSVSTSDNIYRSHGNLAQVSTESKTVETPYSSSSKTDVRLSNPSVYVSGIAAPEVNISPATFTKTIVHPYPVTHHYQQSYSAPSYQQSYSAPSYYSAPVAKYEVPVVKYAAPVAKYVAPVAKYAAPAYPVPVAQHVYSAAPSVYTASSVNHHEPVYAHQAQAAPIYAAPHYYSQQVAQPVVKVAYSPASEVTHFSYNNVNDHVNYSW
ncbi:pupal cuticle protein C1B-like [Cotesia glomerata]|uniref:Uncharacterized protein n=1 Tax=Cotesia glomerata TaxID=32391 RepID=A0AAV7I8G3_COTGL|nr:pupal cuticle protein C1B-like [Cotesia glomerata]KAH0554972.1 hypothetical protein KQX54_014236 [Cotesia glomerata]